MRLHISLSASHNFNKGDRVVCKIAKNEWYIGTVVRAGAKVKVDFDDDFDAIIDENDFKHIKLMTKDRKLKRALTDLEAKVLYEQKKTVKQAATPAKKSAPAPIAKPSPSPISKLKLLTPTHKPSAPKRPDIEPEKPHVPVVPVKKFIPELPREPEVKPPELSSTWAVYLVPNDYRQWSYTVKDKPVGASKFNASRFEFMTAVDAIKAAFKHIEVPVFSLHLAEEVQSNQVKRSTVFDNISKEKALELVAKLTGAKPEDVARPDPTSSEETGDKADKLYLKCGNAVMFRMAQNGGDTEKINYMQYVWARGQTLIFHSLRRPTIRFLKEQQSKSFRRRGHWHAAKRELAMSRRVFNAGEDKFLEVFLHEMSHQAVTDIDHKVDTNKGHGPYWTAWMVRCGIPPSRYDYTAKTAYMDDDEREQHERSQILLKQAMDNAGRLISNLSPPGTPCKIYRSDENRWIKGVTAGIFGTKLMFCHTSDVNRHGWLTLGNKGEGRLYALEPGEAVEDYTSPEWVEAVKVARQHSHIRFTRRSAAQKAARGGYRYDIPTLADDEEY